MTWRTAVLCAATAICATAAAGLMAAGSQDAPTAGDAVAIKQFDAAIAQYLALRKRLLEEVPGPKAESTAGQLNQASDALAAAIQRSRSKAKPGDLFVAPVVPVIKKQVLDAVNRENLGPVLAAIDDEEAGPAKPTIHMRFPGPAPMATMPPSLLAALPRLPASLEYRIIGNMLVLRDVEAALILDLIPGAILR